MRVSRTVLEELYSKYNRREYIHPDPLEFLYRYEEPADREIAGLVAASLAYGRVAQILRSVSFVLDRMPRPARFLRDSTKRSLARRFAGFRHRFTTAEELADMLTGAKRVLETHGTLGAFFAKGMRAEDETIKAVLCRFSEALRCGTAFNSLLPCPEKGSACKRLCLYLRWMVRKDDVDPGGWKGIPTSTLLVPLDTHMHRIALALGLTRRRQADMHTALEVTRAFRRITPDDPAKYDFALTRLGIRDDLDESYLVRLLRSGKAV